MKKKAPKITPEKDSTRQQNVLLEKVYQEVKIIAEGHSGIVRRLDTIESDLGEVKSDLGEVKSELGTVKMAVMDNSQQIKELKKGQEEIKQKLDTTIVDHEQRLQKLEVAR